MTTVMVNQVGQHLRLVVSGHAQYHPGQDIVCASCSILTYTLENVLEIEGIAHKSIIKDGFAEISTTDRRAAEYFYMVYMGYKTLAENYPDHVTLLEDKTSIENFHKPL